MTDEHLRAVRARFDERAGEYDDSAMHRALAAEVAAFAEVRPGSDVLDVATGTGLVLRSLRDARAGARLTGVDLSPGMLAVARERLPEAAFIEADATALPILDATVDVVICVTGMHLFPDPAAAIAEWARVLRPGGRAVTATFGRMDPAAHGGGHGAAQPPAYPTRHDLFETPELLAAAVAPAGFAVARHAWWTSGADRILLAELTR
ncbi:methyltransferase domain-containing protein [Leifsonia sp. NPDC080035]|uniref:Methyltransferase domain-containing protein n=1 Tax=Leifsonia sp. NPDC080035 TaxID=3143936 RepID=A0AAU7GHD1_9MICO